MRVANIIITHKNPAQLERIIRKMQHPDFDFYIHIDKKVDIEPFLYLVDLPHVNFIQNRIVCNWGGYSTLQAMVGSLTEVLHNNVQYGFYNLMSAQDYPIKTNEEIYHFFKHNAAKSFIYYETSDSEWWEGAINRFQQYHLTDFTFKGKTFLERMINKVMPSRNFPLTGELYGGSKSSWWSLNTETATYLADFFDNNRQIDKFLRYCWGTDEFVIPTILMNSPLRESIVNNNLRYIDFPKQKANPKILGMEDFNDIVNSSMLFARKFDMETSVEILDRIDDHLVSV